MKLDVKEWTELCTRIFTVLGVPQDHARTVAEAAITADRRGVGSHGAVRLPDYRERVARGLINPRPALQAEAKRESLLLLDGDNGLGQVVGAEAVRLGCERAGKTGVCAVAVRRSNHMGMLSYYALLAARQGFASFLTCNTPPFVAATGSAEPLVGTNPICWAFPAQPHPVVLDMAISPARGKIKNAAAAGKEIPPGWALDPDGNPTTDAARALAGVLLPVAGPKGYGLGVVGELLSGILTGASYAAHMPHPLEDMERAPDVGHFLLFLDIGAMLPAREYELRMRDYCDYLKSGRRQPGVEEIFLPGEMEALRMQADGGRVEVEDQLYQTIRTLGE